MFFSKYAANVILSVFLLSVLAACGTNPAFNNFESDDDIILEENNVPAETPVTTKTEVENSHTSDHKSQVGASKDENFHPFSTAKDYYKNALKHLQQGDEETAQWSLEKALSLSPNNQRAKKLLHQIKANAKSELGVQSFKYEVKQGDSLSMLSKKYLGDALKFYLLAKYNNIENPSRLMVGRTINIPGHEPSKEQKTTASITAAIASPKSAHDIKSVAKKDISVTNNSNLNSFKNVGAKSVENQAISDAEKAYHEKDYKLVVKILEEDQLNNSKHSDVENKMLVSSYYELSKVHLHYGNTPEAKFLLLKASELDPENPDVNMALIDLDETSETEILYKKGINALKAKKFENAYEFMNKVLALNPDHKRAIEKRKEIGEKLKPYYYRQALLSQRKQDLDKAINYWDEYLALDADNENARIYRSKAVAMKLKLEKFAAK